MTIQFLINWENVLSEYAVRRTSGDMSGLQNVIAALYRLKEYISVSGCAVETEFVLRALYRLDSKTDPDLSVLQSVWNCVYTDYGLKIDGAQSAPTFDDTLKRWQAYIRNSGINTITGDTRFVVVDCIEGRRNGPFYVHVPLNLFLRCEELVRRIPELGKWRRLQHFPSGSQLDAFSRYLSAFSVSSAAMIRIYDPYLAEMFLPAQCPEVKAALLPRSIGKRVEAWRNSFGKFFGVFSDNNHIRSIEVITQWTDHCEKWVKDAKELLRLDEVVKDTIVDKFRARHESLRVDFHFVNQDSPFHDRFLSNGRSCFSIGRGVDICSDGGTEATVGFNLFYGCTRKEMGTFMAFGRTSRSNLQCTSLEMYPSDCTAQRGSLVATVFSAGRELVKTSTDNEFCWRNPTRNTTLTISINPYVGRDDF